MAEVLSQNEIDALLNALSSGEMNVEEIKEEESAKKIKKYDFRNPQKIAKDQLRTLEIIHENFSRLLQTFLSGYLRAPIKISIASVEQYAYSEFNNGISNPAFLSIINFNPLSGQIILDLSTNIVFAIIDRLLGGDGGGELNTIRGFTEIELSLLKGMMTKIMQLIKEAWENVIQLSPTLEKIEINSQFAQIVPPNETIALVTLNVAIGSTEGMLNICIPYIVIEPILDKLSTKFWFSNSKKEVSEKDLEIVKKRMLETSVVVRAIAGSTKVKVRDIANLQIGDVIKFDCDNNLINVNVGTKLKFMGTPGTVNNKMAMKIVNVVKDGENDNE